MNTAQNHPAAHCVQCHAPVPMNRTRFCSNELSLIKTSCIRMINAPRYQATRQ